MALSPLLARLCLIGLAALAVAGVRLADSIPPPHRDPATQSGDVDLGVATIARIAAGEPYYAAVGQELRRRHYPARSVFNWRTPLHYESVAALPMARIGAILFALASGAIITAALAYARMSALRALTAPVLVLGAMLPALIVRPGGVAMAEIPAGVLVALSLNAYVARRWTTGAALGIAAVFLREIAAPYALTCGVLALVARRRRESALWIAGGAVYIVYFVLHAMAALDAMQPGDIAHTRSWIQFGGLTFVLKTLHTYGWLTLLPPALTGMALSAGIAGGFARGIPDQAKYSLLAYLLFFSVAGQPFNYYWGYVTCAIWSHGFLHAGDGLVALTRSARAGAPLRTTEAQAS